MFVLTHIIIESVQYATARVAFTRPASNMTSERTAPWVVLVGADPQSTGVLTIFWASKEFRRRKRAEMVARHCRSLQTALDSGRTISASRWKASADPLYALRTRRGLCFQMLHGFRRRPQTPPPQAKMRKNHPPKEGATSETEAITETRCAAHFP